MKYTVPDNRKIEWLGRFFNVTFFEYIKWKIYLSEEDGGAWSRYPQQGYFEGKTFKEAIDKAWEGVSMDKRVSAVLAIKDNLNYRKMNYPKLSDEELGIQSSPEKGEN